MAPKTVSTFLAYSPLSFPHNPNIFNPNLPRIPIKNRSLVLCRFSQPQQSYNKSTPVSDIDSPAGTGAAAPTPGERFLERHRSFEGAKLILKENKNEKKREKPLKVSTAVACCYGCGATLQTSELDAPEHVDPDTHALANIVDFNGSFLARVRDLAGANPIILVSEVDQLPKGTDLNCVGDWVVEATTKKKLNVHLTSSKSLVGITGVASEIQKENKGRDVYILGSANVGKSAFITALLKLMGEKDPVTAGAHKYKPIQSAVPGTTLGPIQINAFLSGGKLFHTPGVHLHHRQAAVVHAEDLPALAPQSPLRGQSFPNSQILAEKGTLGKNLPNGMNGNSVFWGCLVRIDILKTSLTFYGPKSLQLHMVPTDAADEFYQKELRVLLIPPTGKQRPEEWRGLEIVCQLQIKFEDAERPACDVAISGLGWIAVKPVSKISSNSDSSSKMIAGELHLVVHVPRPVEIFVRLPLPIGKSGADWYQHRELTEKEEETRPKWNF